MSIPPIPKQAQPACPAGARQHTRLRSGFPHSSRPSHRPPQVLDVLNSVGLSDSVLRLAERRQRLDKALVYGGMALTLLLVLGLYWWKKM